MRLIHVILGLLLLVAGAFCVALLVEEPSASQGMEHPRIKKMKVGGDGEGRMKHVGVVTFVLHSGTLTLCAALMALGVAPRRRTRGFWIAMGFATLACLLVWMRLFLNYLGFLGTGEARMVFGFPEPSAWLVYGVWGSAALFSVLYVVGFRRYVFTREDEEAFDELVRETRMEREGV